MGPDCWCIFKGNNEIAKLGNSFNQMVNNIRELIINTSKIGERVPQGYQCNHLSIKTVLCISTTGIGIN